MKYLWCLLLLGCEDAHNERVRVVQFANNCMLFVQQMKYTDPSLVSFGIQHPLTCTANVPSTCGPVKVKTQDGKESEVTLCGSVNITEEEMPGVLKSLEISKEKK